MIIYVKHSMQITTNKQQNKSAKYMYYSRVAFWVRRGKRDRKRGESVAFLVSFDDTFAENFR